MNFVLFGLILISCHVRAIETDDYFIGEDESAFYDFLERCRGILKEGNETLGIQSLDPFVKDKSEIHIDNFIVLDATFTNISVLGLSDYVINEGYAFHLFPVPNIAVNFNFTLNASMSYEGLTGKIGDKYDNIYGDRGNINLYAKNLNLEATIHYTLGNDWEYMIATGVDTKLSLEKLNFRATGLLNDDDKSNVASWYISNTMPNIIKQKQELITTELGRIFTNALNDFACSWTFKEILHMLDIDPFTDIGFVAI